MCLPSCPTYRETGREINSPRGRIALMRAVADGDLEPGDRRFADEMYYCLGCLACQSACPAGVDYATMFETARAAIEETAVLDSARRRFYRWLALRVFFRHPRLLRLAARALGLAQRSGLDRAALALGLVPPHLCGLAPQAPEVAWRFSDDLIAEVEQPRSEVRYRVGLLTGCIQDVAYPGINRDTADVLLANGCEVYTPRRQHCCGSLHSHNGDLATARELARAQLEAFAPLDRFDAVVSNAGGCGSHLRHYHALLPGDPRAAEWDRKVADVHEFLARVGLRRPVERQDQSRTARTIATYHPSCHLLHGQRVAVQPLELLRAVPGLEVVPLDDADSCCGSAGIYSITQPEQSAKLLDEKVARVRATGASVVATANPGCHLQLVNGLRPHGVRVAHPVTLLAEAYRREG
jgi:glycolate oxidase iron-sulfur subunit